MRTVLSLLSCTVAAAFFYAVPGHAQVFKCKGPSGNVVYQDGPCEGAAVVDTRSSRGVSGSKGASSSGSASSGQISTKPTHPVLPDKMRRAIQCVKIDGLSVAEAAKRCEMSEVSIKVNVHRGMRALSDLISREDTT